jgi:hypothetical protein
MIRSDGGGEDIGEGEEGVWFDFFDRGFGCRERERKRMWRKKVCGGAWQCLINIRGACIRNGPIGDCTEIPPGPMMVLVVQILLGLWPKLFLSLFSCLLSVGIYSIFVSSRVLHCYCTPTRCTFLEVTFHFKYPPPQTNKQ